LSDCGVAIARDDPETHRPTARNPQAARSCRNWSCTDWTPNTYAEIPKAVLPSSARQVAASLRLAGRTTTFLLLTINGAANSQRSTIQTRQGQSVSCLPRGSPKPTRQDPPPFFLRARRPNTGLYLSPSSTEQRALSRGKIPRVLAVPAGQSLCCLLAVTRYFCSAASACTSIYGWLLAASKLCPGTDLLRLHVYFWRRGRALSTHACLLASELLINGMGQRRVHVRSAGFPVAFSLRSAMTDSSA
jgi:hypothetical protein